MSVITMDSFVVCLPIVKSEILDFERILQAIGEANSAGIMKSNFTERLSHMSVSTSGRSAPFQSLMARSKNKNSFSKLQ